MNFRKDATCEENLKRAVNENRFDDAVQFMRKKQIYVDKRNTRGTKITLICFYLGLTCHIENNLGGFKVVRKGDCFTQKLDTSEPKSQQYMGSFTAGPTFAAGAGADTGTGTSFGFSPSGAASAAPHTGAGAREQFAGTLSFGAATAAPFVGAGARAQFPGTPFFAVATDDPMTGPGAGARAQFAAAATFGAPTDNLFSGAGAGVSASAGATFATAAAPAPATFDTFKFGRQ